MYTYLPDAIWQNGREGGYLVLGNMVYTVSLMVALMMSELVQLWVWK